MGGEGSGRFRRSGAKRTVEDVCALDVRAWARQGLLVEGQWFSAPMFGRGCGSPLTIEVGGGAVRILRPLGAPAGHTPIGFRIQLDRTYPRFGGLRWWLRCPRPGCGRRVALVYAAGGEFACRSCLGLVYESQRENQRWRALRRAQRARLRLGGSPNVTMPYPLKPQGMHVQTYLRHLRQMFEAEQEFWSVGKLGGNGPGKSRADAEYGCP